MASPDCWSPGVTEFRTIEMHDPKGGQGINLLGKFLMRNPVFFFSVLEY